MDLKHFGIEPSKWKSSIKQQEAELHLTLKQINHHCYNKYSSNRSLFIVNGSAPVYTWDTCSCPEMSKEETLQKKPISRSPVINTAKLCYVAKGKVQIKLVYLAFSQKCPVNLVSTVTGAFKHIFKSSCMAKRSIKCAQCTTVQVTFTYSDVFLNSLQALIGLIHGRYSDMSQ